MPNTPSASSRRPQSSVLCFGEVLWDVLPEGPNLGGAPLNVSWHIARHSQPAAIVSAVGDDDFGQRARRRISEGSVDVSLLQTRPDQPTGTVEVTLDDQGDASYHFPADVAWDHIAFDDPLAEAAASASALVFGSLAMRHETNRQTLAKVLDQLPADALTIMDVNLRPPFREHSTILELTRRASIVKLNTDELKFLLGLSSKPDISNLTDHLQDLHRRIGSRACCITLGSDGAAWWHSDCPDRLVHHPGHIGLYPLVNTIGAGDSFLASLVCTLLEGKPVDENALDHAGRVAAYVTSTSSATPDYQPEKLPKPPSKDQS